MSPGPAATTTPATTVASCSAAKNAVTRFKHSMAKQRSAYFKIHKTATTRKAFVKRQQAKLTKLQLAAKRACQTACQKARSAVTDYKRKMAGQRKAYFKRTKAAKKRKAFLTGQQAKLKALQRKAAAACRQPGGTPQPLPPTPPPPAPPPAPPAPPNPDRDGDGTPNALDCAPDNAAIHPGADDAPEMQFVDSNCDGIDGDETRAVFVSPLGADFYPGTRVQPVRSLEHGVDVAWQESKDVYVVYGLFDERLQVVNGVSVYGGYGPDWSRSASNVTRINGGTSGRGDTDGARAFDVASPTHLQHLTFTPIRPTMPGTNSAAIRAIDSPGLIIENVVAIGASGAPGSAGSFGTRGVNGGNGAPGGLGSCDNSNGDGGGLSGPRAGREGGEGGDGGTQGGSSAKDGQAGAGVDAGPGGPHGSNGDPGGDGGRGYNGGSGISGSAGGGGLVGAIVTAHWISGSGGRAQNGTDGSGAGGGGGGGAQRCTFCDDGGGNGGGEGGDGGSGGTAGNGGGGGGSSFGIILINSSGVIVKNSQLTAQDGAVGGRGGAGAAGGLGGTGAQGGTACLSEIGEGGDGGDGGPGGRGGDGGGGAGGLSVAFFRANSTVTASGNTLAFGAPGPGASGAGWPGADGFAAAEYEQ